MKPQFDQKLLSSLALGALVAVCAVPAKADDTAAEIRLLKAQLRKLEQKVEAQDRQARRTQAAVARVAVAGGGPIVKGPLPVMASCGESSFSFKGICLTPGGFLAGETVFREKSQGSGLPSQYNAIPYGNSRLSRVQETRFSASQSRFSLLAQGKPLPTVVLSGYAEVDFLGAAQTANYNESNSFNLRIRNIYATVDKTDWGFSFLAGQNWSLVTMNGVGLEPRKENVPLTIDPQYVPGFVWARQPQLRATQKFGNFTFAASAEDPATNTVNNGTAFGPNGAFVTTTGTCANVSALGGTAGGSNTLNACNNISLDHIPDAVGKGAYDSEFFGHAVHFEGWGLFRDFYDRTGTANASIPINGGTTSGFTNGRNHDTYGGGGGGSALVAVIPKTLDLQFSAASGKGLGRYGTSQLADVTFNANGTLKPVPETMFLAGAVLHVGGFDVYAYAGQEQINRTIVATGGTGLGSLTQNNFGCDIEGAGSSVCSNNTRRVRQATVGVWDNVYKGNFGLLKAGAQYSYTERTGFSGLNGVTPKATDNVIYTSLRYYPF